MDRRYPSVEEEENQQNNEVEENDVLYHTSRPTTYLRVQNKIQSLEVDLIQFREKNVLTKYLSFTLTQENKSEPDQPYVMSFNVPDEEGFNVIKQFFEQLNWNS